jgi:hypothetical protein
MEMQDAQWDNTRQELWRKISVLTPENFENSIWSNVESLLKETT